MGVCGCESKYVCECVCVSVKEEDVDIGLCVGVLCL